MSRLTKEELYQKHNNWFSNLTPDIYNLYIQISDFEKEYFKDMLLKTPETSKLLLTLDNQGMEYDLFYELDLSLDANNYTYHLDKLESCVGIHDSSNNSITIDYDHTEDKITILHEMVHAYENILDTCDRSFIKEFIFLELYKFLQNQNIYIDEKIICHANILSEEDITREGGKHDIFFYLKTLELDIKCNFPLGTICGYGRENY